ncbi:MAG: hypothetical protein ACTH5M_07310 [Psychrobacter sp.]|uniref:hypothetical protein n=1 Tax=Psychrobacter sp. AOP7-B1-24 TaxID=3457645 RepID=UPI003FB9C3D8
MSSDSNKGHENYSKANVIASYLLFGGATGGSLIGLIAAIFVVLETILQDDVWQNIGSSIVQAILAVPIWAFFGFMIGLIPATLTGCLVASLKLYRNHKGLSYSAIIGTISTVIYTLLFMVFNDIPFSLAACIFAALMGSSSGYFTGLFVLPKA